ncbi:MAG: hypothetical protein CL967_06235 [Euryarchaeota archaeon]|nr:hypothetical protein [Euryarchaeota archaeon]|tara:strand:+ start:1062 stop:1586 length:525 start_codon:yes stop_codon:yes gene_type:complete
MSRNRYSEENYYELERLWTRFHVELTFKAGLAEKENVSPEMASFLKEEGEAAQFEADVVAALRIFRGLEKHTKKWWEWLTVINGSLKARFVCMCLNDDEYYERRRDFAIATGYALAVHDEEDGGESQEEDVSGQAQADNTTSISLKRRREDTRDDACAKQSRVFFHYITNTNSI